MSRPKRTRAGNKNGEVLEEEDKKNSNKRNRANKLEKLPAPSVKSNDGKRGRKRKIVTQEESQKSKVTKVVCRLHDRGPGLVLTLGAGDAGQLGLGEDVLERSRPSVVSFKEKIVDVCAGAMHTVCLTSDGEVYTYGCNDEGALGRDTSNDGSEFTPAKVEIPGKVVQISAGDSHTAALTEDGRAFLWGNFRDSKGGMGLQVQDQKQISPLHILPLVSVSTIASGSDHLALLSCDGHLYTCGCGEQGQLGRVAECFTNRGGRKGLELLLTPTCVPVARSKKGGAICFNALWAGSCATFAHSTGGDIYSCGLNNYNQLGFEDTKNYFTLQIVPSFLGSRWHKISCGLHHTLALDEQGVVHVLGRREYGRLGLGKECEDAIRPTVIPTLKDTYCIDISCSTATSYAVTQTGSVFSWGMASDQLGSGTEEDLWEPELMKGKQLDGRKVVVVSSGGQHAVLLVKETTSANNKKEGNVDTSRPKNAAPC